MTTKLKLMRRRLSSRQRGKVTKLCLKIAKKNIEFN